MAQESMNGYAEKMNAIASEALTTWWENLTKEDILSYLADQPTITADVLRELIRNSDSVLAFDIRFSSEQNTAFTDFHTAPATE